MKSIISPFKTWWSFVLTNILLGFVITLFSVSPYSLVNISIGILWATSISLSQWLGHAYIQTKIEARYSWMEAPVMRLILTFVSVTVYSVFAYAVVQIMMNYLIFGTLPRYLSSFNSYWLIPILISLFISTIIGSIGFFVSWQKSMIRQEQLKTEMMNYKYEALKNQINPHFMFNSLNVLSELVFDDQKLAVKFIQQFSDIYRYVLDKRNEELVTIEEELIFINKYMFLLKIRFEDKLSININLPNTTKDVIIPLALQLLIENAVKHNEISSQNPLKIEIIRDDDYISISNNTKPKRIGESSNKVGLKNLEQQYSFFTKKLIVVDGENGKFAVKIPILKAV